MSITKQDRARAKSVMKQFEIDEAARMQMREETKLQPKLAAYLKSDEGKADMKAFIADKLDRLYKFLGHDPRKAEPQDARQYTKGTLPDGTELHIIARPSAVKKGTRVQ